MADPVVSPVQRRMQNQVLATRAILCAFQVVERLGDTVESAREVGDIHDADPYAQCWFDSTSFTLTVQFHVSDAGGARRALITLIENGYDGFIGPFEASLVKTDDECVVVYLKQGSDREPLDNPQVLVDEASRLMP